LIEKKGNNEIMLLISSPGSSFQYPVSLSINERFETYIIVTVQALTLSLTRGVDLSELDGVFPHQDLADESLGFMLARSGDW
jgi:hypothetical protein